MLCTLVCYAVPEGGVHYALYLVCYAVPEGGVHYALYVGVLCTL